MARPDGKKALMIAEEVAAAIEFLASDESSYVADIERLVDGGIAHV